jgi:hypothetical protein
MTRSILFCLLLALLLPQCGGAGADAARPKSAADDDSVESKGSSDAASSNDEAEAEPTATAEKPRGPSCDDGTCSLCGAGICPAGWYCDESAPGGAACAWLKECAEKATCGCVTKVLGAACKCRDDSGLKVSCN